MNLVEEYCQRHGLTCPIIKRPNEKVNVPCWCNSSMWGTRWVIFQISLRRENYHPSFYQLSWLKPIHNGCASDGRNIRAIIPPKKVEWDDYDIQVIKCAGRDNESLSFAKDLKEAKLCVWEMFLYTMDKRIENLPLSWRKLILHSLDNTISIEERLDFQQELVSGFFETGSIFASKLQQFKEYYDSEFYGDWFVNLSSRMQDKNYKESFSDFQSVA